MQSVQCLPKDTLLDDEGWSVVVVPPSPSQEQDNPLGEYSQLIDGENRTTLKEMSVQLQNTETWLRPESQKMPPSFVNPMFFKGKLALSTSFSEKRKPQDKKRPALTLALSEDNPSHPSYQTQENLSDDLALKAKACLSLIEDPLWKQVCQDVETMMGPIAVLEIGNSQLGSFCPQYKMIDLSCNTRKNAQFAQRFSFVILESLRRYFPTIKTLRVN